MRKFTIPLVCLAILVVAPPARSAPRLGSAERIPIGDLPAGSFGNAWPRWLAPMYIEAFLPNPVPGDRDLMPPLIGGLPIALDSRNIVHSAITWSNLITGDPEIQYFNNRYETRRANGFSAPLPIVPGGPGALFSQPDIACGGNTATGRQDEVHVVWGASGQVQIGSCGEPPVPAYAYFADIYYMRKTSTGWSAPYRLTTAQQTWNYQERYNLPQIRVDNAGIVHVTCRRETVINSGDCCTGALVSDVFDKIYIRFDGNVPFPPPPGPIATLQEVIPGPPGGPIKFRLDSTNQPWVVWQWTTQGPPVIQHVSENNRSGGAWGGAVEFGGGIATDNSTGPDIALDSTDTPHLVWARTPGQIFHRYGVMAGEDQVSVNPGGGSATVVVDSRDQPHVAWGVSYAAQVRNPGPGINTAWRRQEVRATPNTNPFWADSKDMEIGTNDQIHLTDNDGSYTRTMEYNLGVRDDAAMVPVFPGAAVNITNGNLMMSHPLFGTSGVGPTQNLGLVYNSLENYSGYVGQGWKLNYDIYVIDNFWAVNDPTFVDTTDDMNQSITLFLPDGRAVHFRFQSFAGQGNPAGAFLTPDDEWGLFAKMERLTITNVTSEYRVTLKSGDVWLFNTAGKIRRMTDPTGNYIAFGYDSDGYMTQISDQYLTGSETGRTSAIAYEPMTNQLYTRRVQTVTDACMKTYTLGYTGNLLTYIQFSSGQGNPRTTIVYSTANNTGTNERINMPRTFRTPRGTVGSYGWTLRWENDGRFGQIDDPSEVYLLDSDGDGVNPSAHIAMIGFVYTEGDPTAPFRITTVTDRRGFQTVFRCQARRSLVMQIDDPLTGTSGLVPVVRNFTQFGTLQSVVDRWGFTTNYFYDPPFAAPSYIANDNLISVNRPNGAGSGQETVAEYTYEQILRSQAEAPFTNFYLNRVKSTTTWATPTNTATPAPRTSVITNDGSGRVRILQHPDVTRPDNVGQTNVTTEFEYFGDRGALSKAKNEEGNSTNFSNFDSIHAKPQTITRDGGTQSTEVRYDCMGNTTQTKQPQGDAGNCNPDFTNYTLDGMYRTSNVQDAEGFNTGYGYDQDSNQTSVTPPIGTGTTMTYDKRGFAKTTTGPDGNTTQWVDAAGNLRRTQNLRGYKTNSDYDALNRVTQTRAPGGSLNGGSSDALMTSSYVYDIVAGSIRTSTVTRTGSSNRVTTTEYDARGRATAVVEPPVGGNITRTETIYDEQDQVVATQRRYNGAIQTCNVTFRDSRDRVDHSRTQDVAYATGQSPANQINNWSIYNKAGSTLQSVDPLGSPTSGVPDHKTNYTLDVRERVTQVRDGYNSLVSESVYGDDDMVNESRVPDPASKGTGMVTSMKYTYTCRKEAQTSQNRDCYGSAMVYTALSGQVDTVTDALGRISKTIYDPTTQRVAEQITDYGTNQSKVLSVWANGLLTETKVWSPTAQDYTASYKRYYDQANRLEKYEMPTGPSPALAAEITSYNTFSEVKQVAIGSRITTPTYNELGQATSRACAGPWGTVTVSLGYDGSGNNTSIDDGLRKREMQYDLWKGTPTIETFSLNSGGWSAFKSQTHMYNINNAYTGLTDPQGFAHAWTLDNNNRVTEVKYLGVVVCSMTYTPGGLLDTTTLRNSAGTQIAKTTHDYDGLGRHVRARTVNNAGKILTDFQWQYDAVNRVTKLQLGHLGVEFAYGYDNLDNLNSCVTTGNASGNSFSEFTNVLCDLPLGNESTESNSATVIPGGTLAVPARSEAYTYDKGGNRLTKTINGVLTDSGQLGNYNAASQLITEVTAGVTTTHTYDVWGNEMTRVTGATTEAYGYNYLNVMSTYTNSTTGANWQYDFWPTGDRQQKVNLTTGAKEVYVPRFGDVVTEYNSALALTNSYVQGTGIDTKNIRIDAAGNRRHYLGDMVGTVSMTLTDAGAASETSVKDAWGNQIAGNTNSERYGYSQREQDNESGLTYMRHRMYDPARGRFTQTDPLRNNQPDQHYIYAKNNPVAMVDPFGDDPFGDDPFGVGAAIEMAKGAAEIVALGRKGLLPNWGKESGMLSHSQNAFSLAIDDSEDGKKIRDEIYSDLKTFKYFNGGNNKVGRVELDGDIARFTSLGLMGFLSDRINPAKVPVRLSFKDSEYTVSAQTLGGHMLVGVRKWTVVLHESLPNTPTKQLISIGTESWDSPNGKLNEIGMINAGKDAQLEVWEGYLRNMKEAYEKKYKTKPLEWNWEGTIKGSATTYEGKKNPWKPKNVK